MTRTILIVGATGSIGLHAARRTIARDEITRVLIDAMVIPETDDAISQHDPSDRLWPRQSRHRRTGPQ